MNVGRDYMLRKPPRPSAPKVFVDTKLVPMAVNLASGIEVALDRAAGRLGIRPSIMLACAAALASLGVLGLRRRRTRSPCAGAARVDAALTVR